MARFSRLDRSPIELSRHGRTIVEHTVFGDARRELHDERAARLAYHVRVIELLEDGCHRDTPFIDDLVVDEQPGLVAAIEAGDPDARAVYRDWLLDRGDPRGELIALRTAAEPDPRAIASLEKRCGLELFGPLCMAPQRWRKQFELAWRDGWIDEIAFGWQEDRVIPSVEMMQHVLHAPMARFVRSLVVDSFYARTIAECLAGCTCVARIRNLRLTNTWCDATLLAALPALEELAVDDDDAPVRGGHLHVRRLRMVVRHGIPELDGDWPALRRLELVVKSPIGAMRGMLALLDQPALREVTIETQRPLPAPIAERLAELQAARGLAITITNPPA